MDGTLYLQIVTQRFREAKGLADRALAQVPYENWHFRLDPGSNSLVTLVLHMAGNMLSRWSDFLTSDGEKPDRDRDAEFEDAALSREELLALWERGWACLFDALAGLTEADLDRTVTIRARTLGVVSAIDRQFAHYAHHAGQVVFLAKHLAGADWRTLSIPRGGSAAVNARLMGPPRG